ncbi:STAS domain-containing protein [Rhodobacter sp. NTK016B]|uniref:STAS domain-containing protein n=1 Tax=Rhodobacter sp. NTK016B TaxID=2759676 RepID=UPI001A8D44C0|nr:STAS domain-containing protein [Rhodobacter sp. NTK016B]MBN8294935.1 STAS domain-containing protein [Rhodobacter sp. NTK016B]
MADSAPDHLVLDPDAWTDAPLGVIEGLRTSAAKGVVIDASAAGPIPAQVAQLLLAARRAARAAGAELRLAEVSQAARDSLILLGLDTLLSDPSGADSQNADSLTSETPT